MTTKPQTIIIEKKRFLLVGEKEWLDLLEDVNDLKKVLKRRNEPGTEATVFFKKIRDKKK